MGSASDIAGYENRVNQWKRNVEICKNELARARTATEKSVARSNLNRAKEMLQQSKEDLKRAKAAARKK